MIECPLMGSESDQTDFRFGSGAAKLAPHAIDS